MADTASAVPVVPEKKAKGGAKAPKAAAVKKAPASKKPKAKGTRSHPSFLEMISDAILALKERTGSSQYAINKFIEDKHEQLPPNFRKLLLFHLKKLVAAGKLVKVKNSFKLPSARAAPAPAKKPIDSKSAKVTTKPKAKVATKPKAKTATAADKKSAVKPKAKASKKPKMEAKPSKVAKTAAVTSPGKKKAVKKVVPAKKVKSVKSPAGKRARR